MTLLCNSIAFAQTPYIVDQASSAGQILVNPITGQGVLEVCPPTSILSVEEANRQAQQLCTDLIREVDRRYLAHQSQQDKSTFPEASPFLYNYDRILRIQEQRLSDAISKLSPKRILDIHVSWLINRHVDLRFQLQNAPNNKLQKELDAVSKELTYLQNHPVVDGKLKSMISDYLEKKGNSDLEISDKPYPDIYFLRGMISKRCFDNDIALLDFLEGFKCINRDPSLNVADYIVYFPEIQKALSQSGLITDPVDNNDLSAAQSCFAYGYSAFWEGRYKEAVILFSDAIIADKQVPIYWYYRALAWKRLGMINEANLDARKGTIVEKKVFGKRTPAVGFMLQRVQGEDRKWLEYKRIGF